MEIRRDDSSINPFSYTILQENGSIEDDGSTTYQYIFNNQLDINSSNNSRSLSTDESIEKDYDMFYDNDNMIKLQFNTNIENFLEKLPNMNPIAKPETIQLPKKISEVRIRNIEQMVLEEPNKINFRQKCLILYRNKTPKDYILISSVIILILGIIVLIIFLIHI
uniref:ATS domain-containing protein n=1 Tax=Strongyloides venezuelensis TaxID=75913 RepID=A0A0K0FSD0_STRVS